MIGVGFATLGTTPASDAGAIVVALAWAITFFLVARVLVPAAARPPGSVAVDGTWFLAPAAFLADAIGTRAVTPAFPGWVHAGLGWLALVGCGVGFVGYFAVVALAAWRVVRAGVRAQRQAPWWISAGCGGLAAAALGEVQRASLLPGATGGYELAALAVWAAGSVLLVPVLAGSISFLARLRRLGGSPPWPPTFSTAVYALGATQAGRLAGLPEITRVGEVAGVATVVLWLVTAALYGAGLARRVTSHHRPTTAGAELSDRAGTAGRSRATRSRASVEVSP